MSVTSTGKQYRHSGPTTGARGLLIATTLVSLVLAYLPGISVALYPIRIFVTIVHEGCHALATILTGGSVDYIAIAQSGSGVTESVGGWRLLIIMAGYLGATLTGAIFLLLSRQGKAGRGGLVLMTVLLLLVTGFWIRPFQNPFGFFMGIGIAIGLLVAARTLGDQPAAFLLSFLSVQLCLNALIDLRTLLWLTTNTSSDNDAVFMAQAYGLTPWFWAILWAVGACAILFFALRSYWRNSK